jgi:protein phosphatase
MAEYYKGTGGVRDLLESSFIKANQKVFAESQKEGLHGMGTTLTSVVLRSNKMYFAHVGDSRGYLIRGNEIRQFTEDHSYVQSLVAAGIITEDEARLHPERNKITRAIGTNENVKADLSGIPEILKSGDYLLLCSDGLHGVVDKKEILNIFVTFREPDLICGKLIETANDRGGPDNITALIARIGSQPGRLDKFRRFLELSKKPEHA